MTKISDGDVRRLASLSSLQLNDDDVASLQVDLSSILEYIEKLGELDTSGVEPTYQVTDLENVGRDDTVEQHTAGREMLLALAPESDDHSVKVPKVL